MLSPKAAMVADYVFSHAQEVINLSITELALKAGVSQFSVVNCVKTAGYKGYSDFKVALALGMNQSKALLLGDISDSDNPYDILIHTLRKKSQSILDTLVLISEASFNRAVQLIMSARRIEAYGIGSSSHAAEYLELHLRRMGYNTAFYRDPHYQVMSAAVLGPGDLAFGFSTSGRPGALWKRCGMRGSAAARRLPLRALRSRALWNMRTVCCSPPIAIRNSSA
jgi:DNA-binding MurR/RpiR family transcriptional regulator